VSFDWTLLAPTHKPSARNNYYIAHDQTNSNILLFGGGQNFSTAASYLNDTWVYQAGDWTQKSPVHSPSARQAHAYVYDETNHNVVLFGGLNTSLTALNDTWTWDGSDWTQHFPTHTPGARFTTFMTYDRANGNVVMFGGASAIEFFVPTVINDTWTWNGTDWTQHSPTHSPSARQAGGNNCCFDTANNNVVVYGGQSGFSYNQDTWTWNGTDWTQAATTVVSGQSPFLSMAYCGSEGMVVAQGGGRTNPTYLWNGSAWSSVTTASGNAPSTAAMCEGLTAGSVLMWMGQESTSWLNNLYYGFNYPLVISTMLNTHVPSDTQTAVAASGATGVSSGHVMVNVHVPSGTQTTPPTGSTGTTGGRVFNTRLPI
jgi:hypothetical protein